MAAEAVGNLYAWLGLNTAGFDSGLASAQRKLGEFGKLRVGDGLKAAFGEVENALSGMAGSAGAAGSILSGLGITGVAAAAALGVAFQGARQAMAFGDEIGDTAAKLQVTTDYLQEMRYAAHGLGGDFEDADAALESFTKTFGLATSGLSSKALKPFEALGLDPKSFGSVEEALNAVIDKIAALGSAAEQAAVADKLGLTPMLPAIREGTAAIDEMRAEAQRLGFVMEASVIEKAGAANDEYESLSRVLDVEFSSAMAEAIPLVMELTRLMVSGSRAAGEFASELRDIGGGLKASYDAAPDWARDARSKAISYNPLSVGFGNLGKLMDRAALRGRTVEASSLSGLLSSGKSATEKKAERHGNGELLNLIEEQEKASKAKSAADRRTAEATRAAAAAERERLAGLRALAEAMRQTEQRSADYAASLLEEISTMGMSSQQLKVREMRLQAAAAPTQALADHINHLADRYEAQVEVGAEAAEIQKLVNDQQQDSIRTFKEATGGIFHFSTALERAADDLGEAAWKARDLAYDIDDVARAINENDWTSAFAALANVLAKVEKAFAAGATSADKFVAVAGIAQGVGNLVGGSGGAALGGAASGALAGFQMGGPVGAAIGGILGGLGGLFGSSKAKKQAKAQAAAEAAAKEAQRQQQIADTRLALEIDLLRAQGKEQEALNLERKAELDALAKLDASLVAQKQALYDAIDAGNAKAAADEAAAAAAERAATIQAKAQSVQDRIDALTMSDAELLAKARARERADLAALAPELAAMIDRLFGLEDASKASADALQVAAEDQGAATKSLELWNKVQADTADLVAQAAQRQADAIRTLGDSFVDAMKNAADAEKSIRSFAESLLSELGFGGQQQSYAAMRSLLENGVASGTFDQGLAQAFLDASKATQSTSAGYQNDVAWVRSLALNKANDLAAYPERLAQLFASIRGDSMSGLPGFASGGSFTVGGNPGVDQNLLSLNNVGVARVGRGEMISVIPRGMGANDNSLAAELRGLRNDVARLESAMVQTTINTGKTARQMSRWDGDGMPQNRDY